MLNGVRVQTQKITKFFLPVCKRVTYIYTYCLQHCHMGSPRPAELCQWCSQKSHNPQSTQLYVAALYYKYTHSDTWMLDKMQDNSSLCRTIPLIAVYPTSLISIHSVIIPHPIHSNNRKYPTHLQTALLGTTAHSCLISLSPPFKGSFLLQSHQSPR